MDQRWYAFHQLKGTRTLLTINPQSKSRQQDVHVGIVGAGIGGLAAAIAMRRAGAKVTVLEAAEQLGEVRPLVVVIVFVGSNAAR